MSGQRPAFKLMAKAKGSGRSVEIGAAWPSDKGVGFNFKLAQGIEVRMNNLPIKPELAWFNLYDNRGGPEKPVAFEKRSSWDVSDETKEVQRQALRELTQETEQAGGYERESRDLGKRDPDDDLPF